MKQFLLNRSDFILKDLQKYLDVGKIYNCIYKGPPNIKVNIDGYPETDDYSGKYFQDSVIEISVHDKDVNIFNLWLVNGRKREGISVELIVKQDMKIEAVLKN